MESEKKPRCNTRPSERRRLELNDCIIERSLLLLDGTQVRHRHALEVA